MMGTYREWVEYGTGKSLSILHIEHCWMGIHCCMSAYWNWYNKIYHSKLSYM